MLVHPFPLDEATLKLKRPSVARVQIVLDVLLERPDKICIQMGSKEGYWQPIEYENIPPYCHHCWHSGYEEALCHIFHPDLKPSVISSLPYPPKQQWKPIQAAPIVNPPIADPVMEPVVTPPIVDLVVENPPPIADYVCQTPHLLVEEPSDMPVLEPGLTTSVPVTTTGLLSSTPENQTSPITKKVSQEVGFP